MKKVFLIALFLPLLSFSQFDDFNAKQAKLDKNLMTGLVSWAGLNLVAGGVGWATAPNEEMKRFHQMNVMWNTVNLALAIPGYLKARKPVNGLSLNETLKQQRLKETVFLVNAGLDIAYISGGLLLKKEAKYNSTNKDMYNGFGNALIVQGGFLLVFDWFAFAIHRKNSRNRFEKILNKVDLSDNGIGLKYRIL